MRTRHLVTAALLIWCSTTTACGECGSGRMLSDAATLDSGADADADASTLDSGTDAGNELDCTDGVDDDMDGMPDCADPDCAAVVMCVPAPANGWSAPGLLAADTIAAPCAAPYGTEAYVGHGQPSGAPATCSACSCSSPVSTGCAAPPRVCQKSGGCAGTCTAGTIEGVGCIESPGGSASNSAHDGGIAGGTCQEAVSAPTVGAPSWGREGRLCAAAATAAAGCATDELCVVRPATPSPMCVIQAGDTACPAGYGGSREVFFGAFDDQRTCTACSCVYSAGGCHATFTAYSSAACTGTATPMTLDACMGGDPASYFISAAVAFNESCTLIGGGAPTGSVNGATPSTVCCAP